MNRADREFLIDDLLEAGATAGGRALFEQRTLRLVRRRRFARRTAPTAAIFLMVVLLTIVWRHSLPRSAPSAGLSPTSATPEALYVLVRTSPLPADAIVETRPTAPAALVGSDHFARMVSTRFGGYRLLADGELLRLVSPRSGMLVRSGTGEKLVFPDPNDASGFPLN